MKILGLLTAFVIVTVANVALAVPPSPTGAAGGQTSVGADETLMRCSQTLGTLAIDDSTRESWWGAFYQNTQIASLEPMIRLVVQQSNCFVITTAGNADLDRQLGNVTNRNRSDEVRVGSKQQKGQVVAADYYLQPAIIFGNNSSIGLLGSVAKGVGGGLLGALAGGISTSDAQVTMSLFDIRSRTQIAISEGKGSATSFGGMAASLGGANRGGLAGYSNSPAGEATLTGFVDAYNKMVIALQNYKSQTVKGGLGTGGLLKVQGN